MLMLLSVHVTRVLYLALFTTLVAHSYALLMHTKGSLTDHVTESSVTAGSMSA